MKTDNFIVMTEESWANTQLSFVRHTGRINYNGSEYVIVNKEGKDIFQLSAEAIKYGREKAIEPGEPADLCRTDFVPIYRKLGRERFLQFLRDNPDVFTVKLAKERLKNATAK